LDCWLCQAFSHKLTLDLGVEPLFVDSKLQWAQLLRLVGFQRLLAMVLSKVYSAIVRLLGSGFPDEGNEGQDLDTSLDRFTIGFTEHANIEEQVYSYCGKRPPIL